jgi:hypothetical protein
VKHYSQHAEHNPFIMRPGDAYPTPQRRHCRAESVTKWCPGFCCHTQNAVHGVVFLAAPTHVKLKLHTSTPAGTCSYVDIYCFVVSPAVRVRDGFSCFWCEAMHNRMAW